MKAEPVLVVTAAQARKFCEDLIANIGEASELILWLGLQHKAEMLLASTKNEALDQMIRASFAVGIHHLGTLPFARL